MSDIAIRVDHLSKLYHIGRAQQRHDTLRDAIADVRRKMEDGLRRRRDLPSSFSDLPSDTDLWALKDVSFEVQRGEVVGVIGRNGAGKSTLLKILSRITEPTSGRAEIHGRVGSLLEVGTGFHPELTGRENIYLNGAILGMRRYEIERKFDEIVAFAEIERFLDTPVKRYSSGMYVRLAFAVAAHLEPEILLVDEVLAVGDAQFQKKCLGKMGDVAREGRTVLFVSHNLAAIANFCQDVIWIDAGSIRFKGSSAAGVSEYSAWTQSSSDSLPAESQIANLPDDPIFRLYSLTLTQDGNAVQPFVTSQPVVLTIEYEVLTPQYGLRIGFDLSTDRESFLIFRSFHDDECIDIELVQPGHYVSSAIIPPNFLTHSIYRISLAIGVHMMRWIIRGSVEVLLTMVNINGLNAHYADQRPGAIMPRLEWSTSIVSVGPKD